MEKLSGVGRIHIRYHFFDRHSFVFPLFCQKLYFCCFVVACFLLIVKDALQRYFFDSIKTVLKYCSLVERQTCLVLYLIRTDYHSGLDQCHQTKLPAFEGQPLLCNEPTIPAKLSLIGPCFSPWCCLTMGYCCQATGRALKD